MCKSRLFLCCILALSTFGVPGFAKGAGGQTPATEQVCDPLKAEGVTKGLYGLCVAFCEAQHYAAELATKQSQQKILVNYDKKKQENDPDMPCLPGAAPVPQPSCPCWSAAEAGAIDGVLSDGLTTAAGWPAPTSHPAACGVDSEMPYIQETDSVSSPKEYAYIQVADTASIHRCIYKKVVPGQSAAYTLLSIEWGTLTAEEHAACRANLLARQAAMNLCQPIP